MVVMVAQECRCVNATELPTLRWFKRQILASASLIVIKKQI
jgi:hypothetical protein